MSTMLEIQGLTKRFGQFTAVENVSFSVGSGEVLGFLGPNGSGKSTTMKMVTGFLSPTSGTALVCGNDVTRDPITVKRHIGYLPEGAPFTKTCHLLACLALSLMCVVSRARSADRPLITR